MQVLPLKIIQLRSANDKTKREHFGDTVSYHDR